MNLNFLKRKNNQTALIPFSAKREEESGMGFNYKGQDFIHYSALDLAETAFQSFSPLQITIILSVILLVLLGLLANWHLTLITLVAFLTTFYFFDLFFNLYLVKKSFSKPSMIKISDKTLSLNSKKVWPIYTILCPLYKEWQVLPNFIKSMEALDYPKSKLQIMLLLEEDDTETLTHVNNLDLPSYFEITIVPNSLPKTKPKACNYGLKLAKGEYTVIFDAEDMPDPLQLKKAVLAFEKMSKKIVCIQAKLNFYNPKQNLLTKIFTAEYSLWFDLILTGLQAISAPIPLGGTSNHFRTKDLIALKGWDSFNVTEDADLGIRLVKKGYKTAIIDSITLEEANSHILNWFSQRSRWIKGYMQTYLVHMRTLNQFQKKHRSFNLTTFQLVIGGKILSIFINPIMWLITLTYFLFRPQTGSLIESLFPAPVYYMSLFSLFFGNFMYLYYYMIGSKRHGHDHLVKYALFTPFYWLAMSFAAWIALYELIKSPHYWAKTKHGLHLKIEKEIQLKRLVLPI